MFGENNSYNTQNDFVLWTAKETLTLTGFEIRVGIAGMTMTSGYADVEFSNGKDSFIKRYEVLSTYSEGLFVSIGQNKSQTTYKKTFKKDVSKQTIIDSYEGIFATIGISGSTPINFLSFSFARTYSVDSKTKDIDMNGWKGFTKGVSLGLGADCFSVNAGTQITAYRDPEKINNEWNDHPEWFYNIANVKEIKNEEK